MSNPSRFIAALVFASVAAGQSASAQSLSWAATYDGGLTAGSSQAVGQRGVAIDAQGNTYVAAAVNAGAAPEPFIGGGSTNGLIVKYSPTGQAIWSRQIEGRVLAFVLDPQQQLLVLTTLATLKYDTSGGQLWRVEHLFDGHYLTVAAAAPAAGGGIYLAGSTSNDAGGQSDMALARLDGAGRLVWLRTWNGPQNLDDEAQAAGVDATGRVYVSVRTEKQPDIDSYATVAFDAAGLLLWARVLATPDYNGPAAFAADPAGGAFLSVPLGSAPDWRSVKYDASGTLSWSRDFSDIDITHASTPDFAAFAPDGAVYVSGHSSSFPGSPVLVRYSAAGVEQWAKVDTPGFVSATPAAVLSVDAASRAIVVVNLATGVLRTTAYDTTGTPAWSTDFVWTTRNPPDPPVAVSAFAAGVAVGPSGEVRIASTHLGHPSGVLLTVGYATAGSLQWSAEAPAVAPDEGAIAVRFDGAGNAVVLATGFANGQSIFRTLKYDAAGALLWAKAFPGYPFGLAVGNAGEVVVGGRVDMLQGQELAVVKYDAGGGEAWSRTYVAPGSSLWDGGAVIVDGTGNVYVAGHMASGDVRATVVKYAPHGTFLWVRTGVYPVSGQRIGPFLVASPNGNVVFGGSALVAGTFQYHVWALDPAGNTVWNVVGDAPSPLGSNVGALTVDAQSNVIVGDFYRGRVDKLDPAGVRLWSIVSGDRVTSLSVDPAGGIAVASGAPYPTGVAKYSSAGALVWARSGVLGDLLAAVAWKVSSGADGNVFAAGSYWDSSLGSVKRGFVAAFDGAGQLRWGRSLVGAASGVANFNDLDLDATGRLVAAGYVVNGATNYDVAVQSLTDDQPSPLAFHTVTPCRAFDSRDVALGGPAAVRANTLFEAQVAGRCGVPLTARSVALNVTVTGGTDGGHVTLFPAGRVPPPTSTINHPAFITRATQAVVSLGDGGRVVARAIQGSGSVHVILDVSGYFE